MGKITRTGSLALAAAIAATLAVAPGASATPDPDAAPETSSGSVTRLAGKDRIETAIDASKALGNYGGTVIITRDLEYADALASAPLADYYDAPLLLTPTASLDDRVRAELVRLRDVEGVTQAIIVGGSSAVSVSVQGEVEKIFGTKNADGVVATNVERVDGVDRYDTAVQIASRIVGEDNPELAQDLADAEQALADYLAATPNLEAALEALQDAAAALAPAYEDRDDAQVALDEARAELVALTEQLEAVPGFDADQWASDIADAQEAATESGDALAAMRDAQQLMNSLVAIDAEASIQDFVDGTVGDLTDDEIADVVAAAALIGADVEAPAGDAVKLAGDQLPALEDAAEADAQVLADLVDEYLAAAAAAEEISENNAAILEQLPAANAAISAAEQELEDAQTAVTEAEDTYEQAVADLQEAAANVPGTVTREQLEDAVAEARAALIAGSDSTVFLTTGLKFPDALTAGAVAGEENGVVLLTRGTEFDTRGYTEAYLEDNTAPVIAIGGPAAAAIGDEADDAIVGADRFETAAEVAAAFYEDVQYVGVARGYDARFPGDEAPAAADAVVAAAFMANVDSPLVLTWSDELPASTADYLEANDSASDVFIFGGPNAVSSGVENAVEAQLNN